MYCSVFCLLNFHLFFVGVYLTSFYCARVCLCVAAFIHTFISRENEMRVSKIRPNDDDGVDENGSNVVK